MTPRLVVADRLAQADLGMYFRPRDAEAAGISYPQLRRLESLGLVEREGWGLYRRTHADPTPFETVAAVCARVPHAVVCLLTALDLYEIGTQFPRGVWIAIPHKARFPAVGRLPIRVTRFSAKSLTHGVVDTAIGGVPTKVTTVARTVVDCFRFRSKLGTEPGVEALNDALNDRKTTPDEIRRAAEVCGALSLVIPAIRIWAH